MGILDYRMVILDKDSNIEKYPLFSSGMHQECLDSFAKKMGYEYSNISYLVQEGNVLFYNVGNKMALCYLPMILTDEQLYMLDYIENWLCGVEYMEVRKCSSNEKEEYIFEENIRSNFSDIVIQSYYKNRKR